MSNRFTDANELARALFERLNRGRPPAERITHGVYVLSRLVEGYRDLAHLDACLREHAPAAAAAAAAVVGGAPSLPPVPRPAAVAAAAASDAAAAPAVPQQQPCAFMCCLQEGWVPQSALVEGRVVPILGLMEVLAASRLVADTDVLGGGGTNAGFVVERDASRDGRPIAVRVVKARRFCSDLLFSSSLLSDGGAGAGAGAATPCATGSSVRAFCCLCLFLSLSLAVMHCSCAVFYLAATTLQRRRERQR